MEMTREEVSNEYKWDLTTVYKDNDELEKEYNTLKQRVDEFKRNENTFLTSSDNLYNTLKEYFDVNMVLDKMWTFTSHRYDTDITNSIDRKSVV